MIQKTFLFVVVIAIFFGVFFFVSVLGRVAAEFRIFIMNRATI